MFLLEDTNNCFDYNQQVDYPLDFMGRHKKRKQLNTNHFPFSKSGYQDSNLGPPAPKAGALTGLRYTPFCNS